MTNVYLCIGGACLFNMCFTLLTFGAFHSVMVKYIEAARKGKAQS